MVPDLQAHFEEKITFFVRKVKKISKERLSRGRYNCFFNGFLDKFCQIHPFLEELDAKERLSRGRYSRFFNGFWTNFAKLIHFLKNQTPKNDCPAGDTAVFLMVFWRNLAEKNQLLRNFQCKNTLNYWAKKSKQSSICMRILRKK